MIDDKLESSLYCHHALIVSGTGGGKTYFLLTLIEVLLQTNAELYILDPKNVDLSDLGTVMGNIYHTKNVKVKVAVEFIDNQIKATQVSQYELTLHKNNILVYGAGTIGLTYTWLLSSNNSVDVFIRKKSIRNYSATVNFSIKDLRKNDKTYKKYSYSPNYVTEINKEYDLIIVAVNSSQTTDAMKKLYTFKERSIILILQNNWDIEEKLQPYFQIVIYLQKKYLI